MYNSDGFNYKEGVKTYVNMGCADDPISWDAISCLSTLLVLLIVVATILEKLVVLTVFKGPPHAILLIFQSALRPARKPYVH